MAIVHWEPFRDLLGVQERMNRVFNDSLRGLGRANEEDWLGGSWAPVVDIFEHNGNIELKAELPGVQPKDVDVRIENNVLTLSGQRKFGDEVKRDSYHRIERSYGAFTRSFTLPSMIQTDKIKAEFKDGLLHLTLPRREEAKPRQIEIKVN